MDAPEAFNIHAVVELERETRRERSPLERFTEGLDLFLSRRALKVVFVP